MNCKEANEYLHLYLDGELDLEDQVELENHFKFCPACQKRVLFERWFKRNMVQAMTDRAAPDELYARLDHGLRVARRREIHPAWKVAPAAAIAAVILTVVFFPRIEINPTIVEAAVEKHTQDLPLDVSGDNPIEAKNYLQQRVKFAVPIPRFHRPNIRFLGARYINVRDKAAAYLNFKDGLRRYSMVISRGGEEELDNLPKRKLHNREVHVVKRNGYNVYVWKKQELVFSLVSDDPEEDVDNLLEDVKF